MPFNREKFQTFIQQKFFEWRGNTERKWSDFAEYIGIPQQTMAAWKNGYLKRVPDLENVSKLTARFGKEAYEALGIETLEGPGILDTVPKMIRIRFEAAFMEWGEVIAAESLDPDSDAAINRATEIFKKHGITIKG